MRDYEIMQIILNLFQEADHDKESYSLNFDFFKIEDDNEFEEFKI
jgi:hypothetical protein